MPLTPVKKKIMDYLAVRDHSLSELRVKLEGQFDPTEIDAALNWASQQKWMSSPQELSEKLVEQLQRRGKGIHSINQTLETKGLPPVEPDFDSEIAKARKLVFAKYSASDFNGLDFKTAQKLHAKIARFLASRGFDADTAEQILKNDFHVKGSSHDEEF